MRKIREFVSRQWIALSLAFGLAVSPTLAQVFTAPNNFTLAGHYIAAGNPPTGTGCTIAAGSTDTDGNCTTSAASGSIAFASAYAVAPNCVLVDATSAATVPQVTYTTTTAQITLTTVTSAHVLRWHCAATVSG